jgi:hypothetical protein
MVLAMSRPVVPPHRLRGRPPRPIPGRPSACPDGHRGRRILWGRRTWASAPYRRQRVRCLPLDGARPHTFSLDRRQNAAHHPAGEACPQCDVTPTAVDGPRSPVGFFHSGNEIGQVLRLVGRGASLRAASRAIRLATGRFVTDEQGLGEASRECALAARYVDLFGTTIDHELAPARWPSILVLDAKPFWLQGYGAAEHAERWHQGERAGTALIAVGGDDPGRLAAWRIGFAGDETTASWSDVLAELLGEPTFVVTDGSEAIRLAVRRRWPKANLYACEYHLGRALREAAAADGIWPDDPLHARRFERAFWSEDDWTALAELALEANTLALLRWVNANDPLVRRQLALRARFPRVPAQQRRGRAGGRCARGQLPEASPVQPAQRPEADCRVRAHPGRACGPARAAAPGRARQARARGAAGPVRHRLVGARRPADRAVLDHQAADRRPGSRPA